MADGLKDTQQAAELEKARREVERARREAEKRGGK